MNEYLHMSEVHFMTLPQNLQTCCNVLKCVNDGSILEVCSADCHNSHIQVASEQAEMWARKNKMNISADKTKEMAISFFGKHPEVSAVTRDGQAVE